METRRASATCLSPERGSRFWAVAIVFVLACGDEIVEPPPPPPPDPEPEVNTVTVWASFTPDTVSPGEETTIEIRAEPRHAAHGVSRIELRFSGLFVDTVGTSDVPGPGTVLAYFTLPVPYGPIEGDLHLEAAASVRGWEDTATATLTVLDRVTPSVAVYAGLADKGDTLWVSLDVSDNAALRQTALLVSGAATFGDTLLASGERLYAARVGIPIPDTAHVGDTVSIQAIATDWKGMQDTTSERATVVDQRPPVVTGSLLASAPDTAWGTYSTWFPGDTVRFALHAADPSSIVWMGYYVDMGGWFLTSDSVQVTGTDVALEMAFPVLPQWHHRFGHLGVFARDEFGNWVGTRIAAVGFFDGARANAVSIPETAGVVTDVVLDEARNLLFVAQPDDRRIAVLSLNTLTYQPPIATAFPPAGLDLSPSGDSLVVAFRGTPHLGVVRLDASPPIIDTVRLTLIDGVEREPAGVRVAADGVAWLSLGGPYGNENSAYAANLASGEQQVFALGYGSSRVARSRDRSTVGYNIRGQFVMLRHVGDTAFAYRRITDDYGKPLLAMHPTGQYVMAGSTLLDGAFQFIAETWEFPSGVGAFTTGGTTVYATHAGIPGFEVWSIPELQRIGAVFTGDSVTGLVPLADGHRLVVLDGHGAPSLVVDVGG